MEQQTKKIILITLCSLAALVLVGGAIWLWVFLSQFKTYQDSQFKFRVKYPSQWQMTPGYLGTAVTFIRPKVTAFDTVQANFNITVQEVPAHLATLTTFSETITKQMTAVFDKNIKVLEDKEFTFAQRTGHRLIVEAPKPSNLKVMTIWVLKGPFAYIFTFLARADQYKELMPTMEYIIKSFELKY